MGLDYPAQLYGIWFDNPDDGDCASLANPDIAGLGAVLSFVIASLLTTIASVAAAFLDAAVMDDKAFLPSRLQKWLHRGLTSPQLERRKLWRRVLDRLILGFADQQLITGFALLGSGYATKVFPGVNSLSPNQAHWNLLVYMSCLSSSTHLACVLTLRKYFEVHKRPAIIRLVLVILFSLFLIPSIIMSDCFEVFIFPITLIAVHELEKDRPVGLVEGLWYTFQAGAYIYMFFTAIMQLLLVHQPKIKKWKLWIVFRRVFGFGYLSIVFRRLLGKRLHGWFEKWLGKTFWYLVFLSPGTVFVLQIFFATTSLVFTLAQKFAKPRNYDDGSCSLNTPEENNTLGFGQLLALAFLALPLFMAYECYHEEKYEMGQKNGGTYALVKSDTSLLPMTPLQPVSSQSSYFQHSPTPSTSDWNFTQQYGGNLLSPPTPYFNNPDYTRPYGSPTGA